MENKEQTETTELRKDNRTCLCLVSVHERSVNLCSPGWMEWLERSLQGYLVPGRARSSSGVDRRVQEGVNLEAELWTIRSVQHRADGPQSGAGRILRSDGGDAAGHQAASLRGRLLLWAAFIQHGYLRDRAALCEQRPPPLAVRQVTLGLPLPEPLLQLCLDLQAAPTGQTCSI